MEPTKWEKFAKGSKPSMKRRCNERDYTERGIYMITLTTEGRRPLLGTLKGDYMATAGDDRPHVELSPWGECVRECWCRIPQYHPKIEVMRLCIMPDHIHGVLFVHERMERHLGFVIAGFKAGTHKAARQLGLLTAAVPQSTEPGTALTAAVPQSTEPGPSASDEGCDNASGKVGCTAAMPQSTELGTALTKEGNLPPTKGHYDRNHGALWEPNYHDRLLLRKGQLKRMLAYLDDNPWRLLLKRAHPQFFGKITRVMAAGLEMEAMGNVALLSQPAKLQVQCSRHLFPTEIEQRKQHFLNHGRKGAVIVSPCISPGEAEIARACMAAGVPLIVLLLKGFPPFFKPHPRYLEACAAGRLLMLAPYPFQNGKIENMRARCLHLNDLAARLCNDATPLYNSAKN